MKEHALRLAESAPTQAAKLNVLREYLQSLILRELHAQKFFEKAAFVGGTALRFLHQLPRYSEDLDFSLRGETSPRWMDLLKKIESELRGAGYTVTLTHRDPPPVLSASVKFSDLLFEAGLSSHKNQILSVKLELDTHPPKGARFETKVVTLQFPIAFLTYDLPTLFAGKIHAVLARGFTKGRDFFDIGFYLSKWRDLSPNLVFLKNALRQTGWKKGVPSESSWRDWLHEEVKNADWKKIEMDLGQFLERPDDRQIFTKENILSLLRG